jgi:conjugative transfer signal peptidase TraF
MKSLFRKSTVVSAVLGSGILAIALLFHAIGMRINSSKSIPLGVYWTSGQLPEKGAYVLLCPPQSAVFVEAKRRGYLTAGFCPGDFGYMMKKILAVQDDVVTITDTGVSVNGKVLPFSAPLPVDRAGRPLPRYQSTNFVLGNAEVLLMSDVSGTSFDGRYFGPVNRSQIKTVIVPVCTW